MEKSQTDRMKYVDRCFVFLTKLHLCQCMYECVSGRIICACPTQSCNTEVSTLCSFVLVFNIIKVHCICIKVHVCNFERCVTFCFLLENGNTKNCQCEKGRWASDDSCLFLGSPYCLARNCFVRIGIITGTVSVHT